MTNAEMVCMYSRRAIVYLYIARFEYQEIIDQDTLRTFSEDMNKAIYYHRLFQESETVKSSKEEENSNYKRLEKQIETEIRRLRLLQVIMDNDIEQAQALLRLGIKSLFPNIQF